MQIEKHKVLSYFHNWINYCLTLGRLQKRGYSLFVAPRSKHGVMWEGSANREKLMARVLHTITSKFVSTAAENGNQHKEDYLHEVRAPGHDQHVLREITSCFT